MTFTAEQTDAIVWAIGLALDDQENYLQCGATDADYGDEWPEVATEKAEQLAQLADALSGDRLNQIGLRERCLSLAEEFKASASKYDNVGDDLCDTCMSSGVQISHTRNGKTVCVNCAAEDEDAEDVEEAESESRS